MLLNKCICNPTPNYFTVLLNTCFLCTSYQPHDICLHVALHVFMHDTSAAYKEFVTLVVQEKGSDKSSSFHVWALKGTRIAALWSVISPYSFVLENKLKLSQQRSLFSTFLFSTRREFSSTCKHKHESRYHTGGLLEVLWVWVWIRNEPDQSKVFLI